MSCNCSKAKPVPSCVTQLIIGSLDAAYDYYAVFQTPDGRTDKYDMANIYGTMLHAIEDFTFRAGTQYEVWVSRADADNINERTTFTVDGTSLTCFLIEFTPVYDTDNETIEWDAQTVTLEEEE